MRIVSNVKQHNTVIMRNIIGLEADLAVCQNLVPQTFSRFRGILKTHSLTIILLLLLIKQQHLFKAKSAQSKANLHI